MSATAGKVLVDGVVEVNGEKAFALKFLQAREPSWVNRLFFAKYDRRATWLRDLVPAFGDKRFFFQEALDAIRKNKRQPAWGQIVAARKPVVLFGHVEWE